MFIDARTLPDRTEIEADLCIIGAGPAGITIARELAGSAVRVALLEGGGLEPDDETESLNAGANVGFTYRDLARSRRRCFGGATGHWNGWCRPLDDIDFEVREGIPHSGWPFPKSHLDPFYARAQALCQLGPYQYDPRYWQGRGLGPFFDVRPGRVVNTVFQMSPPTRFGSVYRADVEQAPNVETLLRANVVDIGTGPEARSVTGVRAATLAGNGLTVRARRYVLATGGIENARLLLASRTAVPAGLGNQHDLVGRFFMEHPHVNVAFFLPTDPAIDARFYSEHRFFNPFGVIGALSVPPGWLRRERMLGFSAFLAPALYRPEAVARAQSEDGYQSLLDLTESVRRGAWPEDFIADLWNVVSDLGSVGRATVWRLFDRGPGYHLAVRAEQAPNPLSRITLGSERDALGVPRVNLDWRLTDLDFASIRRGWDLLAHEFGLAALGRVFMPEQTVESPWQEHISGGAHHMGTTRMADDPREGVVDALGRVHGIDNLYVAGSSVFPTGGFANPTLTIVALALRLADHLKATRR